MSVSCHACASCGVSYANAVVGVQSGWSCSRLDLPQNHVVLFGTTFSSPPLFKWMPRFVGMRHSLKINNKFVMTLVLI